VSDEACGEGKRCDAFGQCRDAADLATVAPFAPGTAEGDLLIEPAALGGVSPGVERTITLRATSPGVGPLRVAAPMGAEVKCDGDFGPECRLPSLASGATAGVTLRLTAALGADEVRQVRLFTTRGLQTVGLSALPAMAPNTPLAGRYRGVVVVDQFALGTVDAGSTTLPLSVTADLYGDLGSGTLVISDPLLVVHPTGRLVAGLSSGQVSVPAYGLTLPSAVSGLSPEVLASFPSAAAAVATGPQPTVSFALEQRFAGVGLPGREPTVRWRVTLTRQEDLPRGAMAPPVPPAASLREPAVVASQRRTPYELALERGYAASFSPGALAQVLQGGPTTLRSCFAPERDYELAGRDAPLPVPGMSQPNQGLALAIPSRAAFQQFTQSGSAPARALVGGIGTILTNYPATGTFQFANVGFEAPAGHPRYTPLGGTTSFGGGVACAIDFATPTLVNVGFVSGPMQACLPIIGPFLRTETVPAPGLVDTCAEVAQTWGCEVIDVEPVPYSLRLGRSGQNTISPTGNYVMFTGLSGGNVTSCYVGLLSDTSFTGTVTKACRLPRTPPRCAEAAVCQTDLSVFGSAARLVDGGVGPTGELSCSSGADLRLPFDRRNTAKAPDALSACLEDLDRLTAGPDAGVSLAAAMEPGLCSGAGRTAVALALAGTTARQVAAGAGSRTDALDTQLLQRLLFRWAELHGFLARTTLETERLAPVIRRLDPMASQPPLPQEVLAASLRGWGLFLHPRVGIALDGTPDSTLAAPDYRPLVTGGAVAPGARRHLPRRRLVDAGARRVDRVP
jgi:hypothetical protein